MLPDDVSEFGVTDEGLEVAYDYKVDYEPPPDEYYTWNVDPDGEFVECIEFNWVKEELFYSVLDGNTGNESRTECVKYTLIGCDRPGAEVRDMTDELVTGTPGLVSVPNCDEGPKLVESRINYSASDKTGLDEETGEFTCVKSDECDFPDGTPLFDPVVPGTWVDENYPIEITPTKKVEENPLP